MTTIDNVTFRCLRATNGRFSIMYTSLAEAATHSVVYDVYFSNCDIRMIARGPGINHGGSCVVMAGANMVVINDRITTATLKTTRNYVDLTLIKYIDEVPVDLPYDDPIMHMTRNAHSRDLKKYLDDLAAL